MKKFVVIILMAIISPFMMAQPGGSHHHGNHNQQVPNHQYPGQTIHTLALTAAHGEEFVVYVDGDIVNKRASSSILVHNLTPYPHDIYVVLKRPMDKISMIRYQPTMLLENIFVSYNSMNGRLELIPLQPQYNIPQTDLPHICTFEEVERMYNTLSAMSFDTERMTVAKNMVSHNHLAAHQIKRLAESFSFGSSKLDFLKYAYTYCVDQQNYYECLDVLTFDSEKENLMRFLNN